MPITPERITRLREFGLSEYAARAYLALLDLGLTEARDVSNLSRVPQAKVYQVLDQLHDKGLAIILPEFPKKYAPVPFEEFVDRIQKQHIDAAESIDRMRDELTTLFSVVGNVDVGDRGDFTIVRSRRNVLEKLEEVVKATREDLLVIGTKGLRSRPAFLRDLAIKAAENGATTRMLLPVESDAIEPLARLMDEAEIRARDPGDGSASDNVAIVIADGARALLIHFVPDDGDLTNGRDVAVFTDQEAIVGAIQVMAVPMWDHAPALDTLRTPNREKTEAFTHIYAKADDALAALHDAVRKGVENCVCLHPREHESPLSLNHSLGALLRDRATTLRLVTHEIDDEAWDAIRRALPARAEWQARAAPYTGDNGFVLDDREAFITTAGGRLVIHTNDAQTIAALHAAFETAWDDAGATAPPRSVPVTTETPSRRADTRP